MITDTTLAFLRELKDNNEKIWFTEHKNAYQQACGEMLETVIQLLVAISEFDRDIALSGLDPKSCIMRINRDIRFSKDKSPTNQICFPLSTKVAERAPGEAITSIWSRAEHLPEEEYICRNLLFWSKQEGKLILISSSGNQSLQRKNLRSIFLMVYCLQENWSDLQKGMKAQTRR